MPRLDTLPSSGMADRSPQGVYWLMRENSTVPGSNCPEVIQMTLGEKIKEQRTAHGLSQETLAETMGVSRQAGTTWETDQSAPSSAKLTSFAEVCQNRPRLNRRSLVSNYSRNLPVRAHVEAGPFYLW